MIKFIDTTDFSETFTRMRFKAPIQVIFCEKDFDGFTKMSL